MNIIQVFDSESTITTSAPYKIPDESNIVRGLLFQVEITGIATVSMEASLDGKTYTPIPNCVFTNSTIQRIDKFPYVRFKINDVTSGWVNVLIGF